MRFLPLTLAVALLLPLHRAPCARADGAAPEGTLVVADVPFELFVAGESLGRVPAEVAARVVGPPGAVEIALAANGGSDVIRRTVEIGRKSKKPVRFDIASAIVERLRPATSGAVPATGPPARPEARSAPIELDGADHPDVEPPVLLRRVEPQYPREALRSRTSGEVRLHCIVDEEGRVSVVRILRSVEGLDEAAVRAALQWEYLPARHEGRPRAVYLELGVKFNLR